MSRDRSGCRVNPETGVVSGEWAGYSTVGRGGVVCDEVGVVTSGVPSLPPPRLLGDDAVGLQTTQQLEHYKTCLENLSVCCGEFGHTNLMGTGFSMMVPSLS